MNTTSTNRSLHPVLWVAAVAVIVFAITGIAALTGALPSSKSAEPVDIPQPVAAAPAREVVPPVEAPSVETPVANPAPKPVVKHVERRRSETVARNDRSDDVPPPPPPPACRDCGRIESVQRIAKNGDGSGVGAAAGGALGGVLGHQVGNGNGRTLATIAGVVGGALLGNHVEKQRNQTVSYKTVVRYDDGTSGVFDSTAEPAWQMGEKVRVVDGNIQPD